MKAKTWHTILLCQACATYRTQVISKRSCALFTNIPQELFKKGCKILWLRLVGHKHVRDSFHHHKRLENLNRLCYFFPAKLPLPLPFEACTICSSFSAVPRVGDEAVFSTASMIPIKLPVVVQFGTQKRHSKKTNHLFPCLYVA